MEQSPANTYAQRIILPQDPRQIDWQEALLPFKLYPQGEHIPFKLYPEYGATLEHAPDILTSEQVGQMLLDTYGFTRQNSALNMLIDEEPQVTFWAKPLRPTPSGGALFPCEVYLLVGAGQSLPMGLYNYDAAHHALTCLRRGDHFPALFKSLAHAQECASQSIPFVVLLTITFARNSFKYGEFAYRLQSLDSGTVIAQNGIQARRYGLQPTVHYQFLDKALDDLLRLDPLQESVYAVITLASPKDTGADPEASPVSISRPDPIPSMEMPPQVVQPRPITDWPLIASVHQASLTADHTAFQALHALPPITEPEGLTCHALPTPDSLPDLFTVRYKRASARGRFIRSPLTQLQLAQLLVSCTAGYSNDIDGQTDTLQHTLLYCLIREVEDIQPGIYCYRPQDHSLLLVQKSIAPKQPEEAGRQGGWRVPQVDVSLPGVQQAYNLTHTSLRLFPVGNFAEGLRVFGDRWYRMQSMEFGMVVQRLYLAAASLGLGCLATCGYEEGLSHYVNLPSGYMGTIQVMISPAEYASYTYAQSLVF